MNLPFTAADFREVFVRYNHAVGPAPLVLTALAVVAVIAVLGNRRQRHHLACAVLALLWLWSGLVYHGLFFSGLNAPAYGFGLLFLAQAVGLYWLGIRQDRIVFEVRKSRATAILGAVVIGYAILIYPAVSYALGHRWPQGPTFGAPCPVVLFTLGLFFWTTPSFPKGLLIVPLTWCLVGSAAALEFGMYEDWALPFTGILAGALQLRRRQNPPTADHRHPVALPGRKSCGA